jgi:hypothetical protein
VSISTSDGKMLEEKMNCDTFSSFPDGVGKKRVEIKNR